MSNLSNILPTKCLPWSSPSSTPCSTLPHLQFWQTFLQKWSWKPAQFELHFEHFAPSPSSWPSTGLGFRLSRSNRTGLGCRKPCSAIFRFLNFFITSFNFGFLDFQSLSVKRNWIINHLRFAKWTAWNLQIWKEFTFWQAMSLWPSQSPILGGQYLYSLKVKPLCAILTLSPSTQLATCYILCTLACEVCATDITTSLSLQLHIITGMTSWVAIH